MGVIVAALAVAVTTMLIYPLREIAPAVSTGVVYLLAVLLVSTYWGLWLGLCTAVASTAAFNWFHIPPTGRFTIADPQNWVALGVFLAVAVIASAVAEVAHARTVDAERRRQEADLAAEMSQILLGGTDLRTALPTAAARLADALELPWAAIELGAAPGDQKRVAVALDVGGGWSATVLVPAAAAEDSLSRLRERIVPALRALLAAALERERLQAEVVETAALRHSDVIKTALLRAVSHDLRTPLTSIITAGEAVRSPAMAADERDELGKLIVDEGGRLSRLVEKLLDLSRLQAGAAPRRDWCSIEEVVRAAIEHLDDRGGATPVQVVMDRELPLIRADAAQLERVFSNLLENARRYSAGHPVKVRARVVGRSLNVRVIDRGPGIAPGRLPYIFEPFQKADQGGGHGGAGLGLAIVKGFVEANGGRVRVESLPGQGSVFALEFPLEPAPAAVPAADA